MAYKNIHLFRGPNSLLLSETMRAWREKFIEKYTEMNLLDIKKQDIYESFLSDCLAP